MIELGEILSAWPFAASFAAAASARGVRDVRRRAALNEALHELRRPLHVLALSGSAEGTLRMATAALERLERQVNGEDVATLRRPLAARPLLEAALARWRGPAARVGCALELRWRAGEAVLAADRGRLAQAIDNLIANAIDHGGPRIVVEAGVAGGALRIAIGDSGPRRPAGSAGGPGLATATTALAGRRRRGHGLRVVRRVAAEHGGRFELSRTPAGAAAVLELPLLGSRELPSREGS